ncbi:MAG: hypothetical protein Q8921_12715 [Bacteroidota bacterium]|nr:hypothetical protein [Bacteroidota bacterium]
MPFFSHCFFLRDQGFPNTGFASFYQPNGSADGFADSLYRTDDYGSTWKGCAMPAPSDFVEDVAFKDSLVGWACTTTHIYSTTDGGMSWNLSTPLPGLGPNNFHFYKAFYYASAKCLIFSANVGFLISKDDGLTFRWIQGLFGGGFIFIDDMTYMTFGGGGSFSNSVRTTDGGNTWNQFSDYRGECMGPYYSPITGEIYSVRGSSVSGHDTLYVSSDRGNTWQLRHIFKYRMEPEVDGSCQGIAIAPSVLLSKGIWYSKDFGYTWDSIGGFDCWGISSGHFLSMDETGIYACDNNCNVYKYDLPARHLIASNVITYVTPTGYETKLFLDIDSTFKQYPIASFEAMLRANFSLGKVQVKAASGWTLTMSPIDSESLSLVYRRDSGIEASSDSATLSLIYSDSVSQDLTVSITPLSANGRTISECLSDAIYTFRPACSDPILRHYLNDEPFNSRIVERDGSSILDVSIWNSSPIRLDALNTLGVIVGTVELSGAGTGRFQYDLGVLFHGARFNFVRISNSGASRVLLTPSN